MCMEGSLRMKLNEKTCDNCAYFPGYRNVCKAMGDGFICCLPPILNGVNRSCLIWPAPNPVDRWAPGTSYIYCQEIDL